MIFCAQCSGQSLASETDDALLSAILSLNPRDVSKCDELLKSHKSLITEKLIQDLINKAEHLSQPWNRSDKLFLLLAAKDAAALKEDTRFVGYTLYELGVYHFVNGDAGRGERELLESKRDFESIRDNPDLITVLSELGNVYLYRGDFKAARDCSIKGLELVKTVSLDAPTLIGPVPYGIAINFLNLGDTYKEDGEYEQAIHQFQKGLSILELLSKASSAYKGDVADALAELGRLYRVIGDNNEALLYLSQAMDVAKMLLQREKLAGILNSIGVLYSEQNDYSKATEYYQQSLSIYTSNGNKIESARLLLDIGVVEQRQGRYKESINDFREVLAKTAGGDVPDLPIAAFEGLGAVYIELNDPDAALSWLEKAETLARKMDSHIRLAEIYWREGEAYFLKNDLEKAISSTKSAIEISDNLRLPVISYLALTAEGRYFLKLNQDDLAYEALSKAINQSERMRLSVAGEAQGRQLLFESKASAYDLMVDLFAKKSDAMSALRYGEMSKARTLYDILSSGKIDITGAMSDEERTEEKKLNQELAEINLKIRREVLKERSNSKVLGELEALADSARQRYESFLDIIYANHPELRLRRGNTPILTSSVLAQFIRDTQIAYLEYVLAGDRIYLLVASKNEGDATPSVTLYSVDITPQELDNLINEFHDMMAGRRSIFASRSKELYRLLIKPAEPSLKGKSILCIIPDKALWDLPFQALLSPKDRYLIQDYTIYYAPSISILNEISRTPQFQKNAHSLIAFGGPAASTETSLDFQRSRFLMGTTVEAKQIGKMFGASRSLVLTGAAANEETFKSTAGRFDIIHIASHGLMDNDRPLYSYLLLSRDKQDDGLLEAREIVRLNLQADLVVLSACETARGRIGAGEGIVGLSWAFFAAGCRTMIVSQWEVSSASTTKEMLRFYKDLGNGNRNSKAEALRRAALQTLKNPRFSHPFYWAGFIMIGAN